MKPRVHTLMTKRQFVADSLTIARDQTAGIWDNLIAGTDFRLSQVPDYSEFTNLFDQYRILKAKVTFLPSFNAGDALGGATTTFFPIPYFTYATDSDNADAPHSQAALMEYGNARTVRLDKPVTVTITPRVAQSVYKAGATNGYAEGKAGQWIDCETPDVQHYGLKWCIPHTAGSAASPTELAYGWSCSVVVTLYMEFKNTI